MPDLDSYRPPTLPNSIFKAGLAHTPQSKAHLAGVQHHVAHQNFAKDTPVYRTTVSPIPTSTSVKTAAPPSSPSLVTQPPFHTQDAVHCIKPLPSVPKDVDADDGFDDDGSELVFHHRPSLSNDPIESEISSASASSTSSSMESDWYESSLRNQVAKLHIQYTDVDLAQTETPSVFGLRRRIIAAALDHVSLRSADNERRQFNESGLSEWLAHQPSTSQWKEKILRKKISFGRKQAKAALADKTSFHDPMPNGAASPSDTIGSTSFHDKMFKRDGELAEREANFDLVVLSRFETAELRMMVYTEHRQGSWVVKGLAEPGAKVLDEPPLVYSPWDCQIDSRAIVERKKLRSFIELSDTTCAIRCTACSGLHHQRTAKANKFHHMTLTNRCGDGMAECKHCQGTGAVKATYVVCVTLRQSTFLPLTMPARYVAGKQQNAFRAYLPKTTNAMSHVDVLRMRSLEAVRSCALRVGRAHHKVHDARLLMAKATLERRSCNSVSVINRTNGVFRTFDITDGGFVRSHASAGLTEEESRIIETPELAQALSRLPITAVVHPETTYRFIDLELVDMSSSKELSMMVPSRSPSVCTSGSSTNDSYSPSAYSFFQRATAQDPDQYTVNTRRNSQTLHGSHDQPKPRAGRSDADAGEQEAGLARSDSRSRWQLPQLNITPTLAASLAPCSPTASSFHSAKVSLSSMSSLRRPWTRSTPGSPTLTTSGLSAMTSITMGTWETATSASIHTSSSTYSATVGERTGGQPARPSRSAARVGP